MKGSWKSTGIWQSHSQKYGGTFFRPWRGERDALRRKWKKHIDFDPTRHRSAQDFKFSTYSGIISLAFLIVLCSLPSRRATPGLNTWTNSIGAFEWNLLQSRQYAVNVFARPTTTFPPAEHHVPRDNAVLPIANWSVTEMWSTNDNVHHKVRKRKSCGVRKLFIIEIRSAFNKTIHWEFNKTTSAAGGQGSQTSLLWNPNKYLYSSWAPTSL